MASISWRKPNEYDTRSDLERPRQNFESLKILIKNHPDTKRQDTGIAQLTFLSSQVGQLKFLNFDAAKFDKVQCSDEGNRILETKVSVHPEVVMMTINLREIGIIEQRGSYRIEPNQNGFTLHIQELDCYKNSEIEEAHSVKRSVIRNYAVRGPYDWANLTQTLMPDGILHIAATNFCHPKRLTFPIFNHAPVYSSIPNDFPPPANQTYSAFSNSSKQCLICGGVRNAGTQTATPLCATGTQTAFSPEGVTEMSGRICTCPI